MTMKRQSSLTRSAAMILAALALAGCAGTQPPATETEDAPPAVAGQETRTLVFKKAARQTPQEPAEEESADARTRRSPCAGTCARASASACARTDAGPCSRSRSRACLRCSTF